MLKLKAMRLIGSDERKFYACDKSWIKKTSPVINLSFGTLIISNPVWLAAFLR